MSGRSTFSRWLFPNNNAVQVCVFIANLIIKFVICMVGALPIFEMR